MIRNLGHLSYV